MSVVFRVELNQSMQVIYVFEAEPEQYQSDDWNWKSKSFLRFDRLDRTPKRTYTLGFRFDLNWTVRPKATICRYNRARVLYAYPAGYCRVARRRVKRRFLSWSRSVGGGVLLFAMSRSGDGVAVLTATKIRKITHDTSGRGAESVLRTVTTPSSTHALDERSKPKSPKTLNPYTRLRGISYCRRTSDNVRYVCGSETH